MIKDIGTEGLLPDKYIRELEANVPKEALVRMRVMVKIAIWAKNLTKTEGTGPR